MDRVEMVVYLFGYDKVGITRDTFPSLLKAMEEVKGRATLIVHDCTDDRAAREEKRKYFDVMRGVYNTEYVTVYTDNLPLGLIRNAVIDLGIKRHAPKYICSVEDDHKLNPGALPLLMKAMDKFYGELAPNNFRFGMFTLCGIDNAGGRHPGVKYEDKDIGTYFCAPWDVEPLFIGRCNACMRAMPTTHWQNVIGGYDVDDYVTSEWQTNQTNLRNYHHGFTSMVVGDGSLYTEVPNEGRGTSGVGPRVYDTRYCKQDRRSKHL